MALPNPRRRRALRAAASPIASGSSQIMQRHSMGWQDRALWYYDNIGELKFSAQFYSRMLKQLRIFPARRDPGEQRYVAIDDGLPVDLLERIQDPGGGRSTILGNYGRLMFITGEGYLLGTALESEDERWQFCWREDFKTDESGQVTHLAAPNTSGWEEVAPGSAIYYRMWTPHPRKSYEPDSPMRAVLDIAEELLILTKAVRATAVSRLPNGILIMPQELEPPPLEPGGDEDPLNSPFVSEFVEHLSLAVENAGTAEAMAPYVLWAANDFIPNIAWKQLHDPQNDYMEKDLRTEAVKRLALGLDMPPEVLLGMAEANHWTAWQIQDSIWRSHGAPVAEQFCDDLNEAYLRPALREAEYVGWENVVIAYDAAQVVVNPDRSDDANEAYDRGAIGKDALRRAKNFAAPDAMSEQERREWLAIQLKNPALLADEFPEIAGTSGGQTSNGNAPAQAQPVAGSEPPQGGPSNVVEREGRAASARILGAAELALIRCREVAGSRILTHRQSCPDCLQPAIGKPKALVAALVGQETVTSLIPALDPLKLVQSGTDGFRTLLRGWGFSKSQSDALCEMVSVYAARTLFEHAPPLPTGFIAHIERVKEVTDALEH